MYKVIIVEDHDSMRSGLSFIVDSSDKFKSSGSFGTAEAALEFMKSNPVDIVLMDINLPGKNGIECTSIIRDEFPEVKVLICTVFEDDDKIFRALTAGAGG